MKAKRDLFDRPEFRDYAERFLREVAPMIRQSAYMMTIAPTGGTADVKIAAELGYSILLDKPLIVFVPAGRRATVAQKLLRIADHVIEGDMSTEAGREELQRKLKEVMTQ